MMKTKRWINYLIIIIFMIILVFGGQYVLNNLNIMTQSTGDFRYNILRWILLFIIYCGAGILLGLKYFIQEFKVESKWKLNLPKLLIIGIPCFYFSFGTLLWYCNGNCLISIVIGPIDLLYNSGKDLIPFFQFTLGYVILTSFYKEKTKSNELN